MKKPVIDPARLEELASQMKHLQEPMLTSLAGLIAIPSYRQEATVDAPYGPAAKKVLLHFLNLAQSLGFRTANLDNRAGYAEFGTGSDLVAALCHLDVVPAGEGWQSDPFTLKIADRRLIGRGTGDNKGPAIAVLYAMKDLLDQGYQPKGRIRLIVGTDEEKGSSCMAHYVKVAELPTAGFTPDASFPVIYAEKGLLQFRLILKQTQASTDKLQLVAARAGDAPNMIPGRAQLTFKKEGELLERVISGTSGHASSPQGMTNAISKAMQAAAEELTQNASSHPFVDFYNEIIGLGCLGEKMGIKMEDETGPLTLNAGILELDSSAAALTVDIRYPVMTDFAELWQKIASRAAQLGGEAELLTHIPPLHVARDSKLVTVLNQVYQEMTGHAAQPIAIGGGTYARTMPNVVAFGSGLPDSASTAHQADEYITLTELLATAAIYRQALIELTS